MNVRDFFSLGYWLSLMGYEKIESGAADDLLTKESQVAPSIYGGEPDYEEETGKETPANYDDYVKTYSAHMWIYSAVYAIMNSAASVELKLYKKTARGAEEVLSHPILDVLSSVNPNMGRYDLWEHTFGNLELTGNSYWELVPNLIKTKIVEIYPLMSPRVKIIPGKAGVKGYFHFVNNEKVRFEPEDILHFKYFNPDPASGDFYGLSPISAARNSLILDFNSITFNKAFFDNNAMPNHYLSTDQELDENGYKRIRRQWEKRYRGPKKAHSVGILEKGLKPSSIAISPKDMEFILQRKLSREEILAIFGVPPIMVGILDSATYNNAREQIRSFWRNTMIPKLRKVADRINEFLLPRFGDDNLYMAFDFSSVPELQEDEEKRATILSEYVKNSIMTINEARARLRLPPDKNGDSILVPMNVIALSYPNIKPQKVDEEEEVFLRGAALEIKPKKTQRGFRIPGGDYEKWGEKVWREFVAKTFAQEKSFKRTLKKQFQRQQNVVLEKMRKAKSITLKQTPDEFLFDIGEEGELFVNAGRSHITEAVEDGGTRAYRNIGLEISFDVNNTVAQKYIEDRLELYLGQKIHETTLNDLRDQLQEGMEKGESIQDLMDRVNSVYDGAKGYRAERIARSEVIASSNYGSLLGYMDGGIEFKAWFAALDERTRKSHISAHNRYSKNPIRIGDNFTVGSGVGPCPGAIGIAKEDINCRCTLLPIIPEEEEEE